jgi:hypothetical protein
VGTAAPLNDWYYIGMFDANNKIVLTKHQTQGSTELFTRFGFKMPANARVC